MTTEEKARAYDEAVKIARCWLNDPQTIQDCNYTIEDAIQNIFPQLRESEDERIRRALVEYFGPKVQLDFVRGVPIQKIRDWLEKQKEQKSNIEICPHSIKSKSYKENGYPIEPKPAEWSEEDEKRVKEAIKRIDELAFLGIPCNNVREVLQSLRPSWKPSEEQMKALEVAFRKDGDDNYRSTINSLYNDLKKL